MASILPKPVWAPGRMQVSLTGTAYWAHKGLELRVGGEEVALLHGKIKPFVREQGPTMGHAEHRVRLSWQSCCPRRPSCSLGITDITLRCSQALFQNNPCPASPRSSPHQASLEQAGHAVFGHDCFCFAPASSDLSEKADSREKVGDESTLLSPP